MTPPFCKRRSPSVTTKQIPRIHLAFNVREVLTPTIGNNHIRLLLEGSQITNNPGVEKLVFLQLWLINNHLNTLGLDALHDSLNGGSTEIVRAGFHHQAVHTHHLWVAGKNVVGDKV